MHLKLITVVAMGAPNIVFAIAEIPSERMSLFIVAGRRMLSWQVGELQDLGIVL